MSDNANVRGAIVEFDFTVLDGAEIMFRTAKSQLDALGENLTAKSEAMHLAGGNYQGGIAELFAASKNKHDPAKAARELADAFEKSLIEAVPSAKVDGLREFVQALIGKGVKTVISSRAGAAVLDPLLEKLGVEGLVPYAETSPTYGSCKWDAWRRTCDLNGLRTLTTVAVTGSGYGVKSALVAGMSALGVVNDHVAYQDFGGADAVVGSLDARAAAEVLQMLKLA